MRRWALVAVLVLAAALGGCGDDDGNGEVLSAPSTTARSTTTTVTTSTTALTTSTTTTTTPAATTPPPTAPGGPMTRLGEVTMGQTSEPPVGLGDTVPDGRWFGFLSDVDLGRGVAVFDLAQWFILDDAVEAAREDGYSEDAVNNDYWVRNVSTATRDVPLADAVTVTVACCAGGCGQYLGDLGGLAASFASDGPYDLAASYRGAQSQYWLTISGGLVTRIDEQYVP